MRSLVLVLLLSLLFCGSLLASPILLTPDEWDELMTIIDELERDLLIVRSNLEQRENELLLSESRLKQTEDELSQLRTQLDVLGKSFSEQRIALNRSRTINVSLSLGWAIRELIGLIR